MTDPLPLSRSLRTAGLGAPGGTPFDLRPTGTERAALAAFLDISAILDLRFRGTITPTGRRDLILVGDLTARIVQPCVVTLDPVTTRITERVERRYVEDHVAPEGDEIEIPEDDTTEALPQAIDLGAVATEALALALPLYPRSDGASLGETVHAADGIVPLRDADLRPFAGLAGLTLKSATEDGDGTAPSAGPGRDAGADAAAGRNPGTSESGSPREADDDDRT